MAVESNQDLHRRLLSEIQSKEDDLPHFKEPQMNDRDKQQTRLAQGSTMCLVASVIVIFWSEIQSPDQIQPHPSSITVSGTLNSFAFAASAETTGCEVETDTGEVYQLTFPQASADRFNALAALLDDKSVEVSGQLSYERGTTIPLIRVITVQTLGEK